MRVVLVLFLLIVFDGLLVACVDLTDPATWGDEVKKIGPTIVIDSGSVVLCQKDYRLFAPANYPVLYVINSTLNCSGSRLDGGTFWLGKRGIGIRAVNSSIMGCEISNYSVGVDLIGSDAYDLNVSDCYYGIFGTGSNLSNLWLNNVRYDALRLDSSRVSHLTVNESGRGLMVFNNTVVDDSVVVYCHRPSEILGCNNSITSSRFCFTSRDDQRVRDLVVSGDNRLVNLTCSDNRLCENRCYHGCLDPRDMFTWDGLDVIRDRGRLGYYITSNITLCPNTRLEAYSSFYGGPGVIVSGHNITLDCSGSTISMNVNPYPTIFVDNGRLILNNCRVENGLIGVYGVNSTITIYNTTLTGQARTAVYMSDGELTVNRSYILNPGKYGLSVQYGITRVDDVFLNMSGDYCVSVLDGNLSGSNLRLTGCSIGIHLLNSTISLDNMSVDHTGIGIRSDDSILYGSNWLITSNKLQGLRVSGSGGCLDNVSVIESKYREGIRLAESNLSFNNLTVLDSLYGIRVLGGRYHLGGRVCHNHQDLIVESGNLTGDLICDSGPYCEMGCDDDRLIFQVRDRYTGEPLPGVNVEVGNHIYSTDEEGNVILNLSEPISIVYFYKDGYFTYEMIILGGLTGIHIVYLDRPDYGFATLVITCDPGVEIHLKNDNIVDLTDQIPSSGQIEYDNIPTGSFVLESSNGERRFDLRPGEYRVVPC